MVYCIYCFNCIVSGEKKMKKILVLFLALIFLFSFVYSDESEPYSKEDFKQRIEKALEYNLQEAHLIADSGNSEALGKNLARLNELKPQAIKEYNEFYDAYYKGNLNKVIEQTEKLEKIFDEMNSLMVTVIKFEGIYRNIFTWRLQLERLIQNKAFNPKDENYSENITAVKENTGSVQDITDCCKTQSESNCCKAKKKALFCQQNPEAKECSEKEFDFIIVFVVIAVILASALIYFLFVKK